jgi:hypothetical protein
LIGPFSLEEVKAFNDEDADYGIYQIYGGHVTYGSGVLVYIGKAVWQTFAVRIGQHWWAANHDAERSEVAVRYM